MKRESIERHQKEEAAAPVEAASPSEEATAVFAASNEAKEESRASHWNLVRYQSYEQTDILAEWWQRKKCIFSPFCSFSDSKAESSSSDKEEKTLRITYILCVLSGGIGMRIVEQITWRPPQLTALASKKTRTNLRQNTLEGKKGHPHFGLGRMFSNIPKYDAVGGNGSTLFGRVHNGWKCTKI